MRKGRDFEGLIWGIHFGGYILGLSQKGEKNFGPEWNYLKRSI
jgi:hypothetical protein